MFAQTNSIVAESGIRAIALRLHPGDDLKVSLDNYVRAHKLKAACIMTCVGSLQKVVIRYANRDGSDTLQSKYEIVSLTGTLSENGSHLHIAVSDANGKTIGGHLKEGSLVYTTAELVIGFLEDVAFTREVDSTFGYKELVIKRISDIK